MIKQNDVIVEIENTQKLCNQLMQSPHYKKMGPEGVFAIVEKAKSIGISPLDALNGGMFYVQGKVELTANMMNQLIRMNKHSITKDRNSNETICILHGKRADNGDTWSESFSIEEAKLAGIYRNQWLKYPKDMLFARALSRLARQLFPDVIKGCYVAGEISDAPTFSAPVEYMADAFEAFSPKEEVKQIENKIETIDEEQWHQLKGLIEGNIPLKEKILGHLKSKYGIDELSRMPLQLYGHSLKVAKEQYEKIFEVEQDAILEDEEM